MRIATWNIEWFNALFDDAGQPVEDDGPSGRYGVSRREQLAGIGIVMAALDADALFIVEAPDDSPKRSTTRALESFARICGLRSRAAVTGFRSDTEQELALLYDPDVLTATHDPQDSAGAPRFDKSLPLALPAFDPPEIARFARAPLELRITPVSGEPFRMIGVHAKSKAPHGAHKDADLRRIGLVNRRKQLAQCLWLRRRIEAHLARAEPLIVLGDLNDGPGLDAYEGLFGLSGVEIVMGCALAQDCWQTGPGRLYDPHAMAMLRNPAGPGPATARFFDRATQDFFPALLDYILVSDALAARDPRWRIWHPFDDPACRETPDLQAALLAASDHFPVTLDFTA